MSSKLFFGPSVSVGLAHRIWRAGCLLWTAFGNMRCVLGGVGNRDTDDTNELQRLFNGTERGQQAHMQLRDALMYADERGRVTWLQDDTDWHDADELNDFLECHGYDRPLDPDDVFGGADLEVLFFELGLDIEVIY